MADRSPLIHASFFMFISCCFLKQPSFDYPRIARMFAEITNTSMSSQVVSKRKVCWKKEELTTTKTDCPDTTQLWKSYVQYEMPCLRNDETTSHAYLHDHIATSRMSAAAITPNTIGVGDMFPWKHTVLARDSTTGTPLCLLVVSSC